MGWMEVERLLPSAHRDSVAPLLGVGLPRRPDSHDERRPRSTRHQQMPKIESQPDLFLNIVIVLNVLKTQ